MELLDLRKLSGAHLKDYVSLDDDTAIPEKGAILVSISRLEAEHIDLSSRADPVGVRVTGNENAGRLRPYINLMSLILIDFTKFSDGRGFSLAARLRDELGFGGEIRATGALIADHAEFLMRCGVTSAQLPDKRTVDRFVHRLKLYTVWYQDAHDARPTALELRHGRTRRRLAS